MTVNDPPAASRQFRASSATYSSSWAKLTGKRATIYWQVGFFVIVAFALLLTFGPAWGLQLRLPKPGPAVAYGVPVAMVVFGIAIAAYMYWRSRRKYLITVTSDGLTIDRRHGEVYSLADAQLGIWVAMGVALHLQSGRHRFLLGGRDRRVGPATPITAPPVQLVDAWLSDSDFDELLSLDGRWSGPGARGPAAGEPTRCVLFPNPLLSQKMGPFSFRKQQRLTQSLSQPQLFIDLDHNSIRVIDPSTNTVNASASPSQVTATPATYRPGNDEGPYPFSTMPAVAVNVPGMQPLTVGCRDYRGRGRRFSWGSNVPVNDDPPAYAVSAADWLTLIEKLGLAPYLEESTDRQTG